MLSKNSVKNFVTKIGRDVSKRSPELLTGLGIAGMITTTILAVKATPKAMALIEEAEIEKSAENKGTKLTVPETIKVTWKCYIPAVTIGLASTGCLIGAQSIAGRRTAAIATAYKLSETAFKEFKEKTLEEVGEKKVKAIRDKIAEDKVAKNPVNENQIIITSTGNTLCYDGVSGRYFRSDMETIRKAVNTINYRMTSDMYVSLSEFYDELDLEHTDVSDMLGWNIDDGLVDIHFTSKLSNGQPCLVLQYNLAPKYDYSSLY